MERPTPALEAQDPAGTAMEARYRGLLDANPQDLGAWQALGRLLAGFGRLDEAAACYRKVLRTRPEHEAARAELAATLEALGRTRLEACDPLAREAYQEALDLDPERPDCLLGLGDLQQAEGDLPGAVARYERALHLRPHDTGALIRLGRLYALADQLDHAARWYGWALAVDPGLEEANLNLAGILESQGRLLEARLLRGRAPRPQPLQIEEAEHPRRRVLIPWAAGSGNLPIDTLMPRETTTRIKWVVECTTDEQEAALPGADLVFNAIANPEVAPATAERLARFHARRPMLNPPEAILRTRRDRMPWLFSGIPGAVVPAVLRLRRDELVDPDLARRLQAAGLAFPLLVRTAGPQGGKGAWKAGAFEDLARAAASEADAHYLIQYHDGLHADGHYRKYRIVFVDRRPYPYHLAISRNWLVHYYNADMLAAPWKREEERRFLEDPWGVLGPRASEAVAALGERLDLDYAGVDFTLLPDGRILLYEANATMLVHLRDDPEAYPYKHKVVPEIFRAFEALLERRSVRT